VTDAQYDPYQAILRKTWDQCIPYKVLWELTYRCNERCLHCYIVNRDGRGELTTAEAYRIIDELAEAGCLFLTFTGGEALLREDFFDIAGYARQRGFAIRLLTNGTLITPELADQLKALRALAVEISLYGARPETHDAITQLPGSHERSLRALHLLHERGVSLRVKSPLMERTVDQHEALQALADSLGGWLVYSTTLTPADDGSDRPLAQAMRPATAEEFYKRQMGQWRLIEFRPEEHPCNAGINIAAIDPYGNVHPCVQLRLKAGNLREQGFGEIWRDSPVLRRLRDLSCAQLRECPTCELFPYCVRCPGMAHLETGDLLACSRVARTDAQARRAALETRDVGPATGGPRAPCEYD